MNPKNHYLFMLVFTLNKHVVYENGDGRFDIIDCISHVKPLHEAITSGRIASPI